MIPTDKIRDLTGAMRRTEEYRQYQRVRQELGEQDEKKRQVDEFRREKYRMQQFGADMYHAADELRARYQHLLSDPLVTAYLDLENAVCRMIRETCDEIVRGIPLDLPDIE